MGLLRGAHNRYVFMHPSTEYSQTPLLKEEDSLVTFEHFLYLQAQQSYTHDVLNLKESQVVVVEIKD